MKLRLGFVSNSSSSSFCIMGVVLDPDFIQKLTADDDDDFYDFFESCDLDVTEGLDNYSGDYIAGLAVENMREDETLRDFKTRIKIKLDKAGLKYDLKDIKWISDGGYC